MKSRMKWVLLTALLIALCALSALTLTQPEVHAQDGVQQFPVRKRETFPLRVQSLNHHRLKTPLPSYLPTVSSNLPACNFPLRSSPGHWPIPAFSWFVVWPLLDLAPV